MPSVETLFGLSDDLVWRLSARSHKRWGRATWARRASLEEAAFADGACWAVAALSGLDAPHALFFRDLVFGRIYGGRLADQLVTTLKSGDPDSGHARRLGAQWANVIHADEARPAFA